MLDDGVATVLWIVLARGNHLVTREQLHVITFFYLIQTTNIQWVEGGGRKARHSNINPPLNSGHTSHFLGTNIIVYV